MSTSATFWVSGEAKPQGSKMARMTRDGRPFVVDVDDAGLKGWRRRVATEAQRCVDEGRWDYLAQGPVAVTLDFRLAPPKSLARWRKLPWGRPDIDKLARSCNDSLTKVAFADDGQIAYMLTTRVYALSGPPGVLVTLTPLDRVERDPSGMASQGPSREEATVALAILAAFRPPAPEPAQEALL